LKIISIEYYGHKPKLTSFGEKFNHTQTNLRKDNITILKINKGNALIINTDDYNAMMKDNKLQIIKFLY